MRADIPAPEEADGPSKPAAPTESPALATMAEGDGDNDMGDVEAGPDDADSGELERALGPLTLSMDAAKVVEALGEPPKKSEVLAMNGPGDWRQEWEYSDKGLVLIMLSSETGDQVLTAIVAEAPYALETPLGVAVGDPFDEAKRKYESFAAPESDQRQHHF